MQHTKVAPRVGHAAEQTRVLLVYTWYIPTYANVKHNCEVTLGAIPVTLRRFAYDARSRYHSLVWLRLDGDSSRIPFLARRATEPRARASL